MQHTLCTKTFNTSSIFDLPRKRFMACAAKQRMWESRSVDPQELPNFAYVKLNTYDCVNVIAIDFDGFTPTEKQEHDRAYLRSLLTKQPFEPERFNVVKHCQTLGTLMPNVVVADKRTGRAHALYYLERPVWRNTKQMQDYVGDILERMKRGIPGADPQGVGLTGWMKNPHSDHWHVTVLHERKFTLGLFDANLKRLARPTKPVFVVDYAAQFEVGGRNCDLFEVARRWAYVAWRNRGRHLARSEWDAEVLAYVTKLNDQMPVPLPEIEVRSTTRSIAEWVATKYRMRCDAGVMGFAGNEMTQTERCAAAAHRTNQLRKGCSQIKVETARLSHPDASKSEIARITKLDRKTVRKFWPVPAPQPIPVSALEPVPVLFPFFQGQGHLPDGSVIPTPQDPPAAAPISADAERWIARCQPTSQSDDDKQGQLLQRMMAHPEGRRALERHRIKQIRLNARYAAEFDHAMRATK